MHFITIQCTH